MAGREVLERMRADWDERAREDAHYYVAFGRRCQQGDEFFATAADVVRSLEGELKRLGLRERALEIGCGPGRLMRPMSRHFREIHGIDVSEEMVGRARANLAEIPHAQAHAASGSDLSQFPDGWFDFVYSYAVFQHIPSREVVLEYLREARRVLRPDGILRCQINGLPRSEPRYTTWSGARFAAAEIAQFAREQEMQLLALEGIETQYMWTTMRKRRPEAAHGARVRAWSNALSGESAIPAGGPFAALSLWLDGLAPAADLNHIEITIGGIPARPCYIGEPMWDGLAQVNAMLPEGVRTGLVPARISAADREVWVRIVPPGPAVPRTCAVSDGVDLLSEGVIHSGSVKVAMENFAGEFSAAVDGRPVEEIAIFRTDPLTQRHEINFRLPAGTAAGAHDLRMRLGTRIFPPVRIEVA